MLCRLGIALSISDDLADLLNRSHRVTVQNGVPSAGASGLDMAVVVVEEDWAERTAPELRSAAMTPTPATMLNRDIAATRCRGIER